MYLKDLHLRSFRNYSDRKVEFTAQKTILVGNNAQGKSNLLEAVELLSTLKSHRSPRDRDLIEENSDVARIEATIKRAYSTLELGIILRRQGRRTVSLNRENLRRQIDFLGSLNTVQFSSLDLDLVRGGPGCRRNWIDNLLIQLEPIYAYILQQYERIIKQRNALLKLLRDRDSASTNLEESQLKIWDEKLAEMGSRVTRRRARILARLTPIAREWHASISGKTEILDIVYTSNINWLEDDPIHVKEAFLTKIQQRRMAEKQLGTTIVGPHRDEIELFINNTPARAYGSQGQQRTLVLALKLAELKSLEQVIGEAPLLLLDDVLAELDPNRQKQLLNAIGDRFQTLITTTHIDSFADLWLENSQILAVEAGKISNF
ncbi:MAG: DNA replication/repair protein RecF [Prochloraceae cyanobacterium]|nr:DNA replication/repair protein RecF [Prochloraceae cyanobacterium]